MIVAVQFLRFWLKVWPLELQPSNSNRPHNSSKFCESMSIIHDRIRALGFSDMRCSFFCRLNSGVRNQGFCLP